MKRYSTCPSCHSNNIEKLKDGGIFDTVFKCLSYDYFCHHCGYQWDSDYPNSGSHPSEREDSDTDINTLAASTAATCATF